MPGYQRRREEAAILMKNAGHRGIQDPWLDLGAALEALEAGRLEEAEAELRAIASNPAARPIWQAEANLGLIMEARRALLYSLDPGGGNAPPLSRKKFS